MRNTPHQSIKRLLPLTALGASLLLLLSVGFAQTPAPVYGGTVTVAITADPPGWDPTISTSQEIPRVLYNNVYEGLVRFDRDGAIVPALAERWETSDNGLTWTFWLRGGVKFHDGTDLTVDDVIARFERAMDPESGHTNPAYYTAIESVTSPETNVVVFNLSTPSRSLLYNLARPDSIIYPAASQETQRSQPIGTGPFKFTSYAEGSQVVLDKNDDYYVDGVPYLDRAVFRIIGDPNTRFAALQAGDIDMIGVAIQPEQFLQIAADPNLKGTEGTGTTEITVAMNNAREPFSDLRVRQAITLAIDKRAIVDGAMFGLGTIIGSHMSPSEPYYIDLSDTYPYDPQRAEELLAEAGYADGFTIHFELPEPYNIERRAGEVVAQQLREVGINVELSVVEWGTWIQRILLGADYDMTIIGHSEPRDVNLYGNPDYYYQYDNPFIAELLDEAEAAQSAEEELEKYHDIATIIAQDAVNVWLFSPPYLVGARTDIYGFWEDQPTPAIDVTELFRAN